MKFNRKISTILTALNAQMYFKYNAHASHYSKNVKETIMFICFIYRADLHGDCSDWADIL